MENRFRHPNCTSSSLVRILSSTQNNQASDFMPIYEYECTKCKSRIEVFQKISDKPPGKCKKRGGRMEKQLSAPAIQFKGSGWYVTDYAGGGPKAAEKSEREAT